LLGRLCQKLKKLNGTDEEIQNYVMSFDDSKIFLDKIVDLLEFLIPKYKAEGKNMLNLMNEIGFAVMNRMLKSAGYNVREV